VRLGRRLLIHPNHRGTNMCRECDSNILTAHTVARR
jgi:hypothetical protein